MIPNDFGLIRQKEHTLFALLFPYISDVSEMQIEVRYISDEEWINGEFYSGPTGGTTSNTNMKRAIIDVSKYEYVLIPSSTSGVSGSVYTGLTISNTEINLPYRSPLTSVFHKISSYVFYDLTNTDYKYVAVSQDLNHNMPIIGIFRHRYDHVNPKGIIKDAISDILQPIKADQLDGETDGGGDELSSSIEKSDLDSIAQPRTESEANG